MTRIVRKPRPVSDSSEDSFRMNEANESTRDGIDKSVSATVKHRHVTVASSRLVVSRATSPGVEQKEFMKESSLVRRCVGLGRLRILVDTHIDRQRNKETDRQMDKQRDRRRMDRQVDKQTDGCLRGQRNKWRQTNRQTTKQTNGDRQTNGQTDSHIKGQTDSHI